MNITVSSRDCGDESPTIPLDQRISSSLLSIGSALLTAAPIPFDFIFFAI